MQVSRKFRLPVHIIPNLCLKESFRLQYCITSTQLLYTSQCNQSNLNIIGVEKCNLPVYLYIFLHSFCYQHLRKKQQKIEIVSIDHDKFLFVYYETVLSG